MQTVSILIFVTGYSETREAEIANDPCAYAPAAVVLLIYDTASQEWYYASQMNLYGMHVNGILVSNEESIFNGKMEQVLIYFYYKIIIKFVHSGLSFKNEERYHPKP